MTQEPYMIDRLREMQRKRDNALAPEATLEELRKRAEAELGVRILRVKGGDSERGYGD